MEASAAADTHFESICGARRKQGGGVCRKPAGWGTEHNGYGSCKLHGGSTPSGQVSAAREETLEIARTVMGVALDIDPNEALLQCVRITAGEVAYASSKIADLTDVDAVGSPRTHKQHQDVDRFGDVHDLEETTDHPVELHIWIRVRQESVAALARYSKMAIDAGIQERAVRLAEQHGESLAIALRNVFAELDLTEQQMARAPGAIRRHLLTLEAG